MKRRIISTYERSETASSSIYEFCPEEEFANTVATSEETLGETEIYENKNQDGHAVTKNQHT
jgi:hypothetical protein